MADRAFAIALGGQPQRFAHLAQLDGLLQDAEHFAGVDRLQQHVLVRVGGHQDAHDLRVLERHLAQQVAAIAARHAEIGHQHGDARVLPAQDADRFVGAAGDQHFVLHADRAGEVLACHFLVIDVEHGKPWLAGVAHGILSRLGADRS